VVKAKVKSAVSFISDYENELVKVAKARHCGGIICGHIHQPAIKVIDGIDYLNSGDWVESLTALVEDIDGNWKIIYYQEWLTEFNLQQMQTKNKNNSATEVTPEGVLKAS
jgi:UDP-2,3-diacylglucosamine pyrophosphatase LpxH